jgi:hypothetical protein
VPAHLRENRILDLRVIVQRAGFDAFLALDLEGFDASCLAMVFYAKPVLAASSSEPRVPALLLVLSPPIDDLSSSSIDRFAIEIEF